MLQVISVEPIDRRKCRIRLEGVEPIVLYRGEMRRFHLVEGGALSEEDYAKIIKEILNVRARRRALHLLETMDRTQKQIRDKLLLNGYPKESIEAALDYVKKRGYVDDERFAASYFRMHCTDRSCRQIEQDLFRRGIDRQVISSTIEAGREEADEEAQILKWMKKKNICVEQMEDKELYRFYQFLLRKGFDRNQIRHALHKTDF